MNGRQLKHKIEILEKTEARAPDTAQITNTWTPKFPHTIRAKKTDSSISEYIQIKATQDKTVTKFTIRYRNDIHTHLRVEENNITYEIKHMINHKNKNTWLTLVCESTNG